MKTGIKTIIFILTFFFHLRSFSQNVFPATGSVGIGTNYPQANLHVHQTGRLTTVLGNYSVISKFSGTCGAQNVMHRNLFLFRDTEEGNSWWTTRMMDGIGVDISYQAPETARTWWTRDPYDDIQTWGSGSSTYLTINKGNVGIGTSDTKGYKLAVVGTIAAEAIKVKPASAWPDYVFEPSYSRMPLGDLERFIIQHHHLPDVPSANEVEHQGVDLGMMNMALLKKIEELTLHLIEKDKEIQDSKSKVQQQEERLTAIEQRLEQLSNRRSAEKEPESAPATAAQVSGETLQTVTDRGNTSNNSLYVTNSRRPAGLTGKGLTLEYNITNDYGFIYSYDNTTATYKNTIIRGGNLGIGTTNPMAALDVGTFIGGQKLGTVLGRMPEGNYKGEGTLLGIRGYGTQPADYSGKSFSIEHLFYGDVNSSINFYRGLGTTGGYLTFNTSTNVEQMRIASNGNVGIGTTNPSSKLTVAGWIHAREIKVSVAAGADYVFHPGYRLRPLEEVETFINANRHLPEIAPASEMEKDGIALSEMNMKLLKKVEELTLHLIELKKTTEKQQREIDDLKSPQTPQSSK